MTSIIKEKVIKILNQIDQKIVERKNENRLLLLGVLSGEHVLMLGPPGTAKSFSARTICSIIKGGKYFEYLLTKFTTPDEIFGPISISGLNNDRYERKTELALPEAHIVFLDEIFKSSSSILNSLLTIINERKFHNGSKITDVPLISLIGASNEKPAENEEENLMALYDRFIIRLVVDNIQNEENFRKVVVDNCNELEISETIHIDDILNLQKSANLVKIPDEIWDQILQMKRRLKEHEIIISDRRWQRIIKILRISACIHGRSEIDESDLLLLRFLLIDDPSQIFEIISILKETMTQGFLSSDEIENEIKGQLPGEKTLIIKYGRKVIKEQKISNFRKINDESVIPALKARMKHLKESIQKTLGELNTRRNAIEKNIEENIFINWVNIIDFTEYISNEISKLSELNQKIEIIQTNLENSDKMNWKLTLHCKQCRRDFEHTITYLDLSNSKKIQIHCKYCSLIYDLIIEN
ncbi:AAA family ATPase [Candidatus Harpocratesius sp.]